MSSIEMVIIFPATLFIVFGIIQVGVWYYAATVVRSAAQQGAQAAAQLHAPPSAGSSEANKVVAENGALLNHVKITPSSDGQQATVKVTGQAVEVIPFIPLDVHASATAPIEQFQPAPGRS